MTVEYSQDGAVVANAATVSGAPAILISGDDVHFTNTEEGRITGSTAGVPTIQVTGLRATIINAEGGVITRSSGSEVAIQGSAGNDVVVNEGLLKGRVLLGDGADTYTERVPYLNNGDLGDIDFGAGDDVLRHEYAGSGSANDRWIHYATGGAGYDTLVLAGYSGVLDAIGVSGFEALEIGVGANVWNLIRFSGFTDITLTGGGTYNFLNSANPNADLALDGGWVTVGPGSVFRDFTGSDLAEQFEVNSGTIRNVSLGGGNDYFWYTIGQGLNMPAGVVQGIVDGGTGFDWIHISVGGGATLDISSMTTGFEAINTGTFTGATSDVRLINANGFTRIDADSDGKLVLAQSFSPDATVGLSIRSTLILESTATVGQVGIVFSGLAEITVPNPDFSQSVTNDGAVLGDVHFYTGDDLFDGRLGSVGGSVYGYAGNDQLRGGALADRLWGGFGADRLEGNDGDDFLYGESGGDRLDGGAGNDTLIGGPGNDTLTSGTGLDQLSGDDGNDVFLFGANLTAADLVDGGAGRDQIAIQGNYALTLGSGIVGVESIAILNGADTRFGDPGTNSYDYDLTTLDVNVAAGVQMIVDASGLRVGEDLRFDGSAENNGSFFIYGGRGADTLTGGLGNDAFYFGEGGQFGAGDVVNGGPGGIDQLGLRGSYTIVFGANQLAGIESIGLVSAQDTRFGPLGSLYNYNLTMDDGNVALGVQLTLDAFALRGGETLTFNGSAENDGSFRIFGGQGHDNIVGGQGGDILAGNPGADNLTGGGGADTFRFNSTADSTPEVRDHIHDFAPGIDKIDLTRIDADTHAAGDQAFHWVDAFTGTGEGSAGELRAWLDNGNWFIEGDTDGNGVADLRISMTAPPTPIGQSDFLL